LVAAWPHHGFVQFHPFANGNGHVTRALVAWHLVQHDYLPIVVTRDDRNNYIDTLEAADSGDLDPVVIFAAHLHRRDPADHDKASDKRSQKKRVAGERRHQPLQLKERSISRPASHTLNFCHRAAGTAVDGIWSPGARPISVGGWRWPRGREHCCRGWDHRRG
jgi:hypothetical protein